MKTLVFLAVVVGIAVNARADDFDLPRAEFAKYHKQITGKEAPAGLVEFAIDPKVSASGKDAYSSSLPAEGKR